MPPVPLLRPAEVVAGFERFGWRVARRRGSHIILTKPGALATLTAPDHDHVARGTLRALIARAGLTVDGFLAARRQLRPFIVPPPSHRDFGVASSSDWLRQFRLPTPLRA